jgi:hypothetical protein
VPAFIGFDTSRSTPNWLMPALKTFSARMSTRFNPSLRRDPNGSRLRSIEAE